MRYDEEYGRVPELFGSEPEPLLLRHADTLDPALPVLDIGAGQGRNAIELARRGLTVDAIDPSVVAVETLRGRAEAEGLPLKVHGRTFNDFSADGPYGAILVFGLIQILSWEAIARLVERITKWSVPRTHVFITAFSAGDASYIRWSGNGREIGPNSFRAADGEIRTFLEPGQILELFHAFDVVEHREGLGPVHRHGDSPPEQHAMVEAVFRSR